MATNYEIEVGETIQLSIDSDASYTTTFTAQQNSGTVDYKTLCDITESTNCITIKAKALGTLTVTVKATLNNQSSTDTSTITIKQSRKPTIKIERLGVMGEDIKKLKEVIEYFVSKS